FFSSRRRHTRSKRDWSSDVCSSDLQPRLLADRVRGLAGVAEARVVRHLPAALTVELREVEPAALMPGPRGTRLVAVDAAGHALQIGRASCRERVEEWGVCVVCSLM